MNCRAWLSATASLLLLGSPTLAQAGSTQPAKPSTEAGSAQMPPRPSGPPKGAPVVSKPQKSSQPAPQRATPNPSYAYCRGVARYMGLRGVERRKTILDCQLGVMPKVTKG